MGTTVTTVVDIQQYKPLISRINYSVGSEIRDRGRMKIKMKIKMKEYYGN